MKALQQQYKIGKAEAIKLMGVGSLDEYVDKLKELEHIKLRIIKLQSMNN